MRKLWQATVGRIGRHWRMVSPTRSVVEATIAAFAVHVVVSTAVEFPPAHGRYELLLGVAYFVFGLFAAFAIDNARGCIARVNELLKAGDADVLSIYHLAASFGPTAQSRVRERLDVHLQDQIDYFLFDFEKSTPSFLQLFDEVQALDPATPAQQLAYDHMLGIVVAAAERRKQLEALVRQRVSAVEWVILVSLLASLWGLMLTAGGGPVVATLLGGVLMSSLTGIMVVLHHLDSYRWQERSAIWQPLHALFETLDLLPYYPVDALSNGRIDPPTGRIRVAHYPHPYPDMTGKQVEEVEHVRSRK